MEPVAARTSHLPQAVEFVAASGRSSPILARTRFIKLVAVLGALSVPAAAIAGTLQVLGGWSVALELTFVGVFAAGMIAFGLHEKRRGERLVRAAETAAGAPPQATRVVCTGDRAAIEELGPLADVPFEPAIFNASLALPPSRRVLTLWLALAAAAGLLLNLGLRANGVRDVSMYAVWLAGALAFASLLWLRPVYFRVTPGRLEALTFHAWRKEPVERRAWDLRTARVLVDLDRWLIWIDAPESTQALSIELVPGRRRLAHAVLLAAVSTHAAGPLPDDGLIG